METTFTPEQCALMEDKIRALFKEQKASHGDMLMLLSAIIGKEDHELEKAEREKKKVRKRKADLLSSFISSE